MINNPTETEPSREKELIDEYDERFYKPHLGKSGNKVWNLGNGVYATTTKTPPQSESWLTPGGFTYVTKNGGGYLMHEDGQYAIRCNADGYPDQHLMNLKG